MSNNNEKQSEEDVNNLPQWPADAKELPEDRSREPKRARLKWAMGLGVLGGMGMIFFILRKGGDDSVTMAGSFVFAFMQFALMGLFIEYALFDRERRRRRREER